MRAWAGREGIKGSVGTHEWDLERPSGGAILPGLATGTTMDTPLCDCDDTGKRYDGASASNVVEKRVFVSFFSLIQLWSENTSTSMSPVFPSVHPDN